MKKALSDFIKKFVCDTKPVSCWLEKVWQKIEERGGKQKYPLLTLPILSMKLWGLKEGLTIIGGRVSQGKSAFALQIAYDLASQGHSVWFVSLEMTTESLIERLFCNVMEVDNFDVLRGKKELFMEKWEKFKEVIKDVKLLITCGIGKTFEEINLAVELMDEKPNVIIIDYIQAIRNFGDERQELNEYIRKFRELCINNHIVGILCSQVSRKIFDENESKEPTLWNLKGTGGLEEFADTVILLHWRTFYEPHWTEDHPDYNRYKIIIAKQRNGRIGEYEIFYQPKFYKFSEIEVDFNIQPQKELEIIKDAH